MSKIATSRSCSMLGLARAIELSSSVMAMSRDLRRRRPALRSLMALSLAAACAEPDLDRAAVRLEPFGAGERHGGRRQRRERRRDRASGCEVRFMKSSTPRPEEKRALRAVGSTWLEPAT